MTRTGLTPNAICIILLLIACAPPAAAAPVVQLTNDSAFNSYPFWSPDGARVAFRSESRNQALWVVESDGSGLAPLGPDNPAYMMQQWSPDSRTILVSDGNDLYAIPLEDPAAPASPGFGITAAAGALLLTACLLGLRKQE